MARRTFTERRWPDTPEFNSTLQALKGEGSTRLLEFIWKAYDRFYVEALRDVDCSLDDEDLERDITEHLARMTSDAMTGYEPFWVQHAPFERESRKGGSAQPPQYDIAFVLRGNPRIMWPLEAKVLRTDGGVGEYITGLKANFLTCRYSPFSSEAGMLGFLLSGNPEKAFNSIARKARCKLSRHQHFLGRHHRTSDHRRRVPRGKPYPVEFRCHHMMFRLVGNSGDSILY